MAWKFITYRNNQFSTSLKTELPLGQQSMTSTDAPHHTVISWHLPCTDLYIEECFNIEIRIFQGA